MSCGKKITYKYHTEDNFSETKIGIIILGLITIWNMLALNNHSFEIEFIIYMLGILGFVMGLLTLFRENRNKI